MDKQTVNKELTELLGGCWHGTTRLSWCNTCKEHHPPSNNFFTNEGYGKLRDVYDGWPKWKQEDFFKTILEAHKYHYAVEIAHIILHAFHRDNLAPLMLEFLKQEDTND